MKKRLFLIALPMLLLASCTKSESEIETDDAYVSIRTVGNHQYLFYHAAYKGGVCHYEDCDYCKNNKTYAVEKLQY